MSLNYEDQKKIEEIERFKSYINSLSEEKDRIGDNYLVNIKNRLNSLFEKYNFLYIDLSGDRYDLIETIAFFSDEINFMLEEELAAVNPRANHKLFSKKISEMTGYEYQKYLGKTLQNKAN